MLTTATGNLCRARISANLVVARAGMAAALLAAGVHARAVIGAGYGVFYGIAARAATNAGALGVPQPVVAS